MTTNNQLNRRSFLNRSTTALAALNAAPMFLPSSVVAQSGQTPPSEKLNVAIVGLGSRGFDHVMACVRNENLRIGALCDVELRALMGSLEFVDVQTDVSREWTKRRNGWQTIRQPVPEGAADHYFDYRKILEREDIDAIAAAVPDHWHAKLYIDALDAGKHVYAEKPLALTVRQGRQIVQKVKETGKAFQTGLQQRSHYNFQRAVELIRNGYLGKIDKVLMRVRGSTYKEPEPNRPVPGGFDYDMWLGPAPKVPYNPARCHIHFRHFWDYAGGMVTDLGTHEMDIVQWALAMDHSGPVRYEGTAKEADGMYETFGEYRITATYENGTEVIFSSEDGFDIRFYGEKGELFVSRGELKTDPPHLLETELKSGDERFVPEDSGEYDGEGYHTSTATHFQNWLDAIKQGAPLTCDAETGHRSTAACHIANICGRLGRELHWDPENEQFVNDDEAGEMLDVYQREPYAVRL